MALERKTINGVLHYRNSPDAEFEPLTPEQLTDIIFAKTVQLKQAEESIEFLKTTLDELTEDNS